MESVRQSKVAKLLQKELAEIFRANASLMFDGAFISVTVVRISSDLSSAKAYVSIMPANNSNTNSVFKLINEQKTHIRKIIGDTIKKQVRIIPEISYFIDDSYEYAERINKLFKD